MRVAPECALWLACAIAGVGALAVAASAAAGRRRIAYSIELTGDDRPGDRGAGSTRRSTRRRTRTPTVAIIRLDTPGGLDSSMREIVKDILAAPMPVVVYVSPNGARAASAGVYITQAADVAAMAPQTNIGSATPISIGPGDDDEVLGRKIRNDAAAYMRALAEAHGRNPELAEQMVTRGDQRHRGGGAAAPA